MPLVKLAQQQHQLSISYGEEPLTFRYILALVDVFQASRDVELYRLEALSQTLKRHLSALGMTPDEYRAKWGLPSGYPMVAPNYAAIRSALAKSNGLGRKPAEKPVVSTKRTRKPKVDA